jgi:hypothetical protein
VLLRVMSDTELIAASLLKPLQETRLHVGLAFANGPISFINELAPIHRWIFLSFLQEPCQHRRADTAPTRRLGTAHAANVEKCIAAHEAARQA